MRRENDLGGDPVFRLVVRLAVLAVLLVLAGLFAYIGIPGLALIVVIIICLTNLPLVGKLLLTILCGVFGAIGAIFRRIFR